MGPSPAPSNELTRSRANLVLAALFLGTFILGSAETVVVGLLDLVAHDLKVSLSSAGLLVTAYALGLSIGGPVLAALTIRFGRRPLLLIALVVYLVLTVPVFLSGSFPVIIAARVLTGAAHGLFVGVALSIATTIVPVERAGRAISIVIGGFAVSLALGVPLGTLVGRSIGWRDTFAVLTVIGIDPHPDRAEPGRPDRGRKPRCRAVPDPPAAEPAGAGHARLRGRGVRRVLCRAYLHHPLFAGPDRPVRRGAEGSCSHTARPPPSELSPAVGSLTTAPPKPS